MDESFICLLPERSLIRVFGVDAGSFLQTLVTNDVEQGPLVYACLLTPQGRFLHDFFISRDKDGFLLECETARREDLMRRLNIFKLRAKVEIEDCAGLFDVYAATEPPEGSRVFQDPRLSALGYRFYLAKNERRPDVVPLTAYVDRRIRLGVPEGSLDMKPEIDTLSDVNLDRLNAVSWDKGCYVGQEVTARMKHRALVKRRMVIISGNNLAIGEGLMQDGHSVGEIRSVNSARTQGLAILKLTAMAGTAVIMASDGKAVSARLPAGVQNT